MFTLHSTLERDSLPLMETDDCLIRLVNDARYPWSLVVPAHDGLTNLHDLDEDMYTRVMRTVRDLGAVMSAGFRADKINTAAIGNMVPQLHIHVVARFKDDACWPAPIWGVGKSEPLSTAEIDRRTSIILNGMTP